MGRLLKLIKGVEMKKLFENVLGLSVAILVGFVISIFFMIDWIYEGIEVLRAFVKGEPFAQASEAKRESAEHPRAPEGA